MRHLHIPHSVYEERKERYTTRIKAMLEYATSDTHCRSRMLLRYFGERNEHNCQQCDVCLSKHDSGLKQGEFEEIETSIYEALKEKPFSVEELIQAIGYKEKKVQTVLQFLLREEVLTMQEGIITRV